MGGLIISPSTFFNGNLIQISTNNTLSDSRYFWHGPNHSHCRTESNFGIAGILNLAICGNSKSATWMTFYTSTPISPPFYRGQSHASALQGSVPAEPGTGVLENLIGSDHLDKS